MTKSFLENEKEAKEKDRAEKEKEEKEKAGTESTEKCLEKAARCLGTSQDATVLDTMSLESKEKCASAI